MCSCITSAKEFILQKCLPFFAKPICLMVVMLQMAILDYYLIEHTSQDIHIRKIEVDTNSSTESPPEAPSKDLWYLWVIADVLVLAFFIVSFVKSHQDSKLSTEEQKSDAGIGGHLPYGYISWFVYSVFAAVKIGLIFRWTAQTLDLGGILGINLLKLGISLSAVIFLMLVMTHNYAEKGSMRAAYIALIEHTVMTDLLDTTDILHIIIYKESKVALSFGIHKAIIFIACMNLILPTILLIALSKSRAGNSLKWQKSLEVIHKVFYQAVVNIPLLVLRSFLTHVYKNNISVFAVKNVVAIGIIIRTIVLKAEDAVRTGREEREARNSMEMERLSPASANDQGATESEDVSGPGPDEKPAMEMAVLSKPQPQKDITTSA